MRLGRHMPRTLGRRWSGTTSGRLTAVSGWRRLGGADRSAGAIPRTARDPVNAATDVNGAFDRPHSTGRLQAADLIPDHELRADQRDLLGHTAIAERVADLLLEAEVPFNVAIFAPWGSGKSSFAQLVEDALARRREGLTARLVRYDVWKYGGSSLQRNFISHVARELALDEADPDHRRFFRGLYEKRRTVDLDMDEFAGSRRWQLFRQTTMLLFVFLLVAVVFRGCAAWIAGDDIARSVADAVGEYGPIAAALAIAAAGGLKVLEGARVEVEQDAPSSDDHFTTTFRALIKLATSELHCDRLVFYVDELDRCEPAEVLRTLTEIKTFLDEDRCAFIVAIDREALLHALTTALPSHSMRSSVHEVSAYSFIDKVFQHQLALPPLRVGTPADYAFALVRNQGGLWGELATAEPHLRALTAVLYALIAPHVTNPRRIKVLLNAFATNARIAEARELPWKERAREIAKLTALQTEFPEIRDELMQRREGGLDDPEVINKVPPSAARERLKIYLDRTRGIPDPQPDLLYSGLADPTLSLGPELERFVEQHASEPDEVLQRLEAEPERRPAVARFLMQLADGGGAADRGVLVSTLLAISDDLAEDAADLIPGIAETVEEIAREGALREDDVAPALRAAYRLGVEALGPLIDLVVGRPGTRPSRWLLPVLGYHGALTDGQRGAIRAAFARSMNDDSMDDDVMRRELSAFVLGLEDSSAEWLMYSRDVARAGAGVLGSWDAHARLSWARELNAELVRSGPGQAARRGGLWFWLLRADAQAYYACRTEVDAVMPLLSARAASLLAVAVMDHARHVDTSRWREVVQPRSLQADDMDLVREIASRFRQQFGSLGAQEQDDVAMSLIAMVDGLPADSSTRILKDLGEDVRRAAGDLTAGSAVQTRAEARPAETIAEYLRLVPDSRSARELALE
jgi:hypothetical protein